jgi:hypothetical protein
VLARRLVVDGQQLGRQQFTKEAFHLRQIEPGVLPCCIRSLKGIKIWLALRAGTRSYT